MMWRKFFMKIASNGGYINKYCNNTSNRFQKHFYEWYLYNLSKNNTLLNPENQIKLIQLQSFSN